MDDLIKTVKDGTVNQTQNSNKTATTKSSNNELGKDAFLQLLVTQMKYQDPLQPNTDTEYISQLATFSQLEQMQNLSTVSTNSQAFSLVGKSVIIKTDDTVGKEQYIDGKVDFVNMSGGKAQLSVNGKLYSIDQLDSVIGDAFIRQQSLPGVKDKISLAYDGSNPKDLSFNVNLGSGDYSANDVAVLIDNTLIDSKLVHVSGNKVTVDKSAFADYADGSHKISVVFNNAEMTTVTDKITLTVTNSTKTSDTGSGTGNSDGTNGTGSTGTDATDNTNGTNGSTNSDSTT